jgi:outer membrane immunogenic protein
MRRPRLHLRISPTALKSAIGIVAIVALSGTSVQAADLPVAPSSAPIPILSPSWTGPYIGLDFGMRYDAVDANVTSATVGTPPTTIALSSETAANFNIALHGGIYGGWNYQINADYVAGVEADFGWANETANLHGSATLVQLGGSWTVSLFRLWIGCF